MGVAGQEEEEDSEPEPEPEGEPEPEIGKFYAREYYSQSTTPESTSPVSYTVSVTMTFRMLCMHI